MIHRLERRHHRLVSRRESQVAFVHYWKPFQGARNDKLRSLSLLKHLSQNEPLEQYRARRSSSITSIDFSAVAATFQRMLDISHCRTMTRVTHEKVLEVPCTLIAFLKMSV